MKSIVFLLVILNAPSFAGVIQVKCRAQYSPTDWFRASAIAQNQNETVARDSAESICFQRFETTGYAVEAPETTEVNTLVPFCKNSGTAEGELQVTCHGKYSEVDYFKESVFARGKGETVVFKKAEAACYAKINAHGYFIERQSIIDVKVIRSFCP